MADPTSHPLPGSPADVGPTGPIQEPGTALRPNPGSRLRRSGAVLALFASVAGGGYGVFALKQQRLEAEAQAAAGQPEPSEVVEAAVARLQPWARSTTAIGTASALRSITLRNELPGTVRQVLLQTGQVVDTGEVLVELDVSVEQAELAALQAEARLAASMLTRMEQALENQGASAADVDRARAERDKADANVARTQALIERKRVRAPFRARVGMLDLHLGQYLEPGTRITTLQGVDDAIHVNFAVTQEAAAALSVGGSVEVSFAGRDAAAEIVAIDARVESETRNTWIRARLAGPGPLPQPGSSVRVRVPVEPTRDVVMVPVSALRRGPAGDHVFVLVTAPDGALRATTRRVAGGAVVGDEVVVVEGLAAGERVAAAGSFKLREGVLVHDKALASKPQ